ncbi:MAG: nitroreductase, partial [Zetaproteobacteria bacterium CG02_land_8_20_14_3_00_50_9]
AFAVSMLGEFDRTIEQDAANYRQLFIEAGLIGQALYLEAEHTGFRGTGIGCYFDPAIHKTLGFESTTLQSTYHFTVGTPLVDERIETLPPYAHLER